ncbi:MAG: RHS repeat-associated core domain-containing protein [Arcobacteraceae bacterium]|nr:RHS repeat-associated core domain-containing protein [Arcobacteraceae bacterium]
MSKYIFSAYDKLSRLTQSIDYNQNRKTNIVEYSYDELNNITKSTQNGKIVNKTYDNNSNLTSLNPNSFEVTNQYNNLNLLEKVSVNNNEIANFTYNKDKRLTQIQKANGITLDIDYDKRAREVNRIYSNNIFSQTTKYDLNSNIIREDMTLSNNNIIKEYEYDLQDRLINDLSNNHIYNYDKVGNQIFTTQNNINETRVVNEDNEYTSITDSNIEYDVNGNVKIYKDKEFIYDYNNRLVELKKDNITIATYTYDAQNRRVSKTLDNITTEYIYNNNQVIQEYENDTLTNSYIYASYIDDPIAYTYNNNTYYYVKDRQYSIQAVTNSSGNIVESYSYNSFGIMTMKDQNGGVIFNSNVNNTITFTGRRYDTESGLYYYRNRMYSATLGRFISKDPKGYVDGMNLYAYVKNNPLKYLDAFGTTSQLTKTMSHYNPSDLGYMKVPDTDYSQGLSGVEQTATWFRPKNHDYVVGRDTIKYFEPGGLITGFLEDYIPGMHTMGTIHDPLVDSLTAMGVPDALANVPTMSMAYTMAIKVETVNSVVDGINNMFGTDYDLSFEHNHSKD